MSSSLKKSVHPFFIALIKSILDMIFKKIITKIDVQQHYLYTNCYPNYLI